MSREKRDSSNLRKFSRSRASEAPYFDIPTPRNPVDGEYAKLSIRGIYPHTALMQVAAEDTHDNYVICRGFDTRYSRFFDYVEGDAYKKGIAVAKPYGVRGTYPYSVGEIYAAFLPVYQFKDMTQGNHNPGKAATSTGHPADLDEEIEFLQKDDEEVYLNWMFVEGSGTGTELTEFCLAENHPGRNTPFNVYKGVWSSGSDLWTYPDTSTTYKAFDRRYGAPFPDAGAKGLFTPRQSDTYGIIYECVSLDCESPGDCED